MELDPCGATRTAWVGDEKTLLRRDVTWLIRVEVAVCRMYRSPGRRQDGPDAKVRPLQIAGGPPIELMAR